jgi:hypothetical protein
MHTNISTPVPTPPFTPNWNLNERHALMELDQEMADFAELFRVPATPSLQRRLRDEDSPERSIPSDLASIPSDQFFSKYLTSESHTAEGGYSPSDPPFISESGYHLCYGYRARVSRHQGDPTCRTRACHISTIN